MRNVWPANDTSEHAGKRRAHVDPCVRRLRPLGGRERGCAAGDCLGSLRQPAPTVQELRRKEDQHSAHGILRGEWAFPTTADRNGKKPGPRGQFGSTGARTGGPRRLRRYALSQAETDPKTGCARGYRRAVSIQGL